MISLEREREIKRKIEKYDKTFFVIFLEILDGDELRTVKAGLLTLASSAPWKENKWDIICVHDFDRQDYFFSLYMLFFFPYAICL